MNFTSDEVTIEYCADGSQIGTATVGVYSLGSVGEMGATVSNSGIVSLYKYTAEGWVESRESLEGIQADDRAGSSVALSGTGNIVAIGAPGNRWWYGVSSSKPGRVDLYAFDKYN